MERCSGRAPHPEFRELCHRLMEEPLTGIIDVVLADQLPVNYHTGTGRMKWQVVRDFVITRYHATLQVAQFIRGSSAVWIRVHSTYLIRDAQGEVHLRFSGQ